jgi:nucleoside 2-deoxyribosyltransferase
MELFPAADDEQFEFIKREIDLSDYYIVIIAGRYGSLADDGISFTEKEFDYAFAQGKPILAFLIQDPKKLTVDKSEEEKKGKSKLKRFKEKARKSRVVKFYNNPDELKSQVLQALSYQFRVNPKRGWIPAGLSKREDLEEIRSLFNKVTSLEAENAELKSQRKDATARLGQGQDPVSWQIDATKLVFSENAADNSSATPIPFPSGEAQLSTTWDELLIALYSSGSSRLDSEDVELCLFHLLASKISDPALRGKWRVIAIRNYARKSLDLRCLGKAKRDIHRQLTGLGLIEEIVETRYKEPAPNLTSPLGTSYAIGILTQTKPDPIPAQIVVWRLTRRGEEQLALIGGFRRNETS